MGSFNLLYLITLKVITKTVIKIIELEENFVGEKFVKLLNYLMPYDQFNVQNMYSILIIFY